MEMNIRIDGTTTKRQLLAIHAAIGAILGHVHGVGVSTDYDDANESSSIVSRENMTGEELRAAYTAPNTAFTAVEIAQDQALKYAEAHPAPTPSPAVAAGFQAGPAPGAVVPQPPAAPAPSVVAAAPSQTVPAAPQAGAVPPPPATTAPAPQPAAAQAVAAPSTSAIVVDSSGRPWDARIDAKNKAINADGTWRKLKGLNDEGYRNGIAQQLRNEYKAAHPAPVAVAIPVAAQQAAVIPPPPAQTAAVVPPPPPPVATDPLDAYVAAATAAAVPPAPQPQGETFQTLMDWVTGMMTTGKLQFPNIVEECNKLGGAALGDFASRPELMALVPQLGAALRARVPA